MKMLWAIFIMLAACTNVHAKNPGESAQTCLQVSSQGDRIDFTNVCSEKIFVLWCGELSYSKERCGDGPDGAYYTHSNNIPPGRSVSTNVKGRYSYAACKGSISFGNDGEYEDTPGGGVTCLPR